MRQFMYEQFLACDQAGDRVRPRPTFRLPFLLMTISFILTTTNVSANMPMSLVFIDGRAYYWWASLIAVLMEFVAIRWIFGISWPRALLASALANASTLVLGIVIYRNALAWIYVSLHVTPGSLGDVAGSLFLVSLIDTAIELAVLGLLFSLLIVWRRALAFFVVNALSAGIILLAPLASPDERFDNIPAQELRILESYYASEISYMNHLGEALVSGLGLAKISQEAEIRSAERHLDQTWLAEQRSEVNGLRFHEISFHFRSKHPPEDRNETSESWFVHLGLNPHDAYGGAIYKYSGDGCSEPSGICYSRIVVEYRVDWSQNTPNSLFEGYLASKRFVNNDYTIDVEAKLSWDFRDAKR